VTTGFVSVEHDDHVAIVTLERPQALNAISGALADELADIVWAPAWRNK
jgi:enoyl-CoA hydratase/carnithine racemase